MSSNDKWFGIGQMDCKWPCWNHNDLSCRGILADQGRTVLWMTLSSDLTRRQDNSWTCFTVHDVSLNTLFGIKISIIVWLYVSIYRIYCLNTKSIKQYHIIIAIMGSYWADRHGRTLEPIGRAATEKGLHDHLGWKRSKWRCYPSWYPNTNKTVWVKPAAVKKAKGAKITEWWKHLKTTCWWWSLYIWHMTCMYISSLCCYLSVCKCHWPLLAVPLNSLVPCVCSHVIFWVFPTESRVVLQWTCAMPLRCTVRCFGAFMIWWPLCFQIFKCVNAKIKQLSKA